MESPAPLPDDVQVLIKVAYFLTHKGIPVRAGEHRDIIAYRVPVREFERLRAKVALLQPRREETEGAN